MRASSDAGGAPCGQCGVADDRRGCSSPSAHSHVFPAPQMLLASAQLSLMQHMSPFLTPLVGTHLPRSLHQSEPAQGSSVRVQAGWLGGSRAACATLNGVPAGAAGMGEQCVALRSPACLHRSSSRRRCMCHCCTA